MVHFGMLVQLPVDVQHKDRVQMKDGGLQQRVQLHSRRRKVIIHAQNITWHDYCANPMKKEAGIQKEYSVEQLISCSGLKNGCEGATVETAWNKMNLKKNENRG